MGEGDELGSRGVLVTLLTILIELRIVPRSVNPQLFLQFAYNQ